MDEDEAEEEGDGYGFDGVSEVDGFNRFNRANGRGGGLFIVGSFGLGEVMGLGGSAVARGYLLAVAVGGEACGVAGLVGLDEDGGGLTNGVVEGEGYNLAECVVDGFIVGLLGDGPAASATHCRQGKHRYEGSR